MLGFKLVFYSEQFSKIFPSDDRSMDLRGLSVVSSLHH